ncbi:MAG: ABC-type transport auxiliary lipoprotein family protein [Pseudomonadota bacterium]
MKINNIFLLCLILTFAGCAGPKNVDTYYYQLTVNQASRTYDTNLSLVIGPVSTPEVLKRRAVVSYGKSKTNLIIPNTQFWAGDLRELMLDTIELDLKSLFPNGNIYTFKSQQNNQVQYKLEIQMQEFAGHISQNVFLAADWQVINQDNEVLIQSTSAFTQELMNKGYSAYTLALSNLLGQLTNEIARELDNLE